MSKKRFSETKVGKFLLDKGSNLFNVVGDVLPDNGVLGVVKNLIEKDNTIPQQDKDIALELIKQDQIGCWGKASFRSPRCTLTR